MEKCNVSASVSSVRRVLLSCKNIKRLKVRKKPSLTTKHEVSLCKRKSALEKGMEKGTIFR